MRLSEEKFDEGRGTGAADALTVNFFVLMCRGVRLRCRGRQIPEESAKGDRKGDRERRVHCFTAPAARPDRQ